MEHKLEITSWGISLTNDFEGKTKSCDAVLDKLDVITGCDNENSWYCNYCAYDHYKKKYKHTATVVDGKESENASAMINAIAIVGVDLDQKGMQMPQRYGAASSYGKKYALGNLFLIDDTQDSDATNTHGKAASVIERVTKPAITKVQMAKAVEYVTAGGKVEAIESKYKLTNEQRKNLTKTL